LDFILLQVNVFYSSLITHSAHTLKVPAVSFPFNHSLSDKCQLSLRTVSRQLSVDLW